MFTIWNWLIAIGILFVIGVFSIYLISDGDAKAGITIFLSSLIIVGIGMAVIGWAHTHTATGVRAMKDYHSELNNGIDREIIITAEDGREIFRYEGKVDIESNHEDNYIKFDDENNKRYIIYYGALDTITIIEK